MKIVPVHSFEEEEGYFEIIRLRERNSYDHTKPHKHSYFEIFLFEKGGGSHDINFTNFLIDSNSIHFVFPNQVHKVQRELDTYGYVILVSKEYLKKINYKLYVELFSLYYLEPILTVSPSKFSIFLELIEKLTREYTEAELYSEEIIESYIKILFNHLLRIKEGETSSEQKRNTDFTTFISFLILIEDYFSEHRAIQFYTSKLKITERKLNSLCKKYKNETSSKLIKERTVLEAKKLLINTDFSIKEIVYSLNYDDTANFNKFFKSYVGISPSQFRLDFLKNVVEK